MDDTVLRDGGLAVDHLGYVAAALAYLVAALHLFHPQRGFPRLVRLIQAGGVELLLHDPRPLLFVISGVAILIAVKLVLLGFPRKPIYALGMALMVAYVGGYFAWHLTGHGGFLPGRAPQFHGQTPLAAVVSHLRSSPLALLATVAETALFVVLAVLSRSVPDGEAAGR